MTRTQTPAQTRAAALGLAILGAAIVAGLLFLVLGVAALGACLGQIAALGFDIWAPRMAEELAALWR